MEVESCLQRMQIEPGQVVWAHCDAIVTAPFSGSVETKLRTFFGTIVDYLGPNGTLIVPAFSMSYTQGQVYDVDNSPSTVGLASEFFRRLSSSQRSLDPIYSVSVIGALAHQLTASLTTSCFGRDSAFDQFFKENGVIVFFGCSIDRATFVHYVEECRGVSYRYFKEFAGVTRIKSEEVSSTVNLYVRNLTPDTLPDHSLLKERLENKGLLRKSRMGRIACSAVTASAFYDTANELLDEDEFSLIRKGIITADAKGSGEI